MRNYLVKTRKFIRLHQVVSQNPCRCLTNCSNNKNNHSKILPVTKEKIKQKSQKLPSTTLLWDVACSHLPSPQSFILSLSCCFAHSKYIILFVRVIVTIICTDANDNTVLKLIPLCQIHVKTYKTDISRICKDCEVICLVHITILKLPNFNVYALIWLKTQALNFWNSKHWISEKFDAPIIEHPRPGWYDRIFIVNWTWLCIRLLPQEKPMEETIEDSISNLSTQSSPHMLSYARKCNDLVCWTRKTTLRVISDYFLYKYAGRCMTWACKPLGKLWIKEVWSGSRTSVTCVSKYFSDFRKVVLPFQRGEVLAMNAHSTLPVCLFCSEKDCVMRKCSFLQNPRSAVQWALINELTKVITLFSGAGVSLWLTRGLRTLEEAFIPMGGWTWCDSAVRRGKNCFHHFTFFLPVLQISLNNAKCINPKILLLEFSGSGDCILEYLWKAVIAEPFQSFIIVLWSSAEPLLLFWAWFTPAVW